MTSFAEAQKATASTTFDLESAMRFPPGTKTFDVGTRRPNPELAATEPFLYEAEDARDTTEEAGLAIQLESVNPLVTVAKTMVYVYFPREMDIEFGYWSPGRPAETFVLVGVAQCRKSTETISGWLVTWCQVS